ncbi:MAG: hypothetical protein ACTSQE_07505 [Candidatus Heimdallarchaeaceae archaeon]
MKIKIVKKRQENAEQSILALSISLIVSFVLYIYGGTPANADLNPLGDGESVFGGQAEVVADSRTTPTPTRVPEPTKTPNKPLNEIEELIHNAFKDEGDIAVAIAKAESRLNPNREGIHKAGKHKWSSDTYKGECSIGLFQINLASDACNGRPVHASKIPGDTLEAKIAWLKIPENNIKIAKQLYERQGFYPWSTYTNGAYEREL